MIRNRDDLPWTAPQGVGRIPSHAGHVRAIDAGGRGSPVDGAVGVDSLVAVAAVALLAPSALGLPPQLLVPQVVLLLVDGIVIGLYVLGLARPPTGRSWPASVSGSCAACRLRDRPGAVRPGRGPARSHC
jgi:hypothetical protein